MRKFYLIISIALIVVSCGNQDETDADHPVDHVLLYEAGDTLQQDIIPTHIQEWLHYYAQIDPGFSLGRFKSSGVNLHIAELPAAISKGNEQDFKNINIYTPDQKKYIDLFSYNFFLDNGRYVTGEIDQQVVLGDLTNNTKKQLMYYGPAQSAEAAGWLNDHSFLLATTSRTDDEKNIKAEILLFNLKDSLYMNFQLDHMLSRDAVLKRPVKFLDGYLNKQKVN